MGLLYELSKEYKTLSIVGMAKNAGKTTALNYFIEEAMDEGIVLGITSTGRDGESTDLVTGTDKPKVYLDEGTLVSVPKGLYDLAEAGLEIVRMTRYSTSIGQLMICRVRESGYVQIAGPVTTAESKMLCEDMFELGAQLVLIDGAIDRKSIAAPETSDAIILSTGAVLSRNMKTVASETAHVAGLYRLPRTDEKEVRDLIEKSGSMNRIMVVRCGELYPLEIKTGLASGRYIDEAIDDDTTHVYLPGALTESVIRDISLNKLKRVRFILKDPTKIFLNLMTWQKLRKKGFDVSVLENIRIAAITVNPVAPLGYSFEHEALLSEVQKMIPDIPVIDVRL